MIVTARARWIIMLAVTSIPLGIVRHDAWIVAFSLACLLWIGIEWFVFRIHVDYVSGRMHARRLVKDRLGTVRILWEGRPCEIQVKMGLPRLRFFPPLYVDVRDLLPAGAQREAGQSGLTFPTGMVDTVQLNYRLRPQSVGALRFVGLRLVMQDLHGFFQAERFLPNTQKLRVLPWANDSDAMVSTKKLHNALSPPGVHRLARAGSGSELLEIRDYVPGDSPRSIAWKVSAKRGALMCKQFESEVPVRCHLVVDLSRSVRLGYPGPCAGGRLVSLAATIANTLVAHRDPVGMSILEGRHISIERPSANRKAVMRMVDRLAAALDKPIEPVAAAAESFLSVAADVARIRHPQMWEQTQRGFRSFLPSSPLRLKKLRMAAFLSAHYRQTSARMASMVELDSELSRWLQRFLADHQAPYCGSLFSRSGDYLFDDREKVDRIARLIQRAVLHGRDNELFVIMAELSDITYDLGPLLRVAKVARARHHRVMLLCAWPPDCPLPGPSSSTSELPLDSPLEAPAAFAWRQRHQSFQRLRKEMARLRVPVVPAADQLANRLVLNQLELIRAGRVVA